MQVQQRELEFDDYMVILRRRKWWIIIPAVVIGGLGLALSYVLPARWTSQSSILIERQVVSDTLVQPIINEDLNARLANVSEQILSRTRLQPVIEHNQLYASTNLTMDDKLATLRKAIVIKPLRSDLPQASGLPGFTLAFTADQPRLAQQVCGEITSMFLTESLRLREQSAEGTTDFLQDQLEQSRRNLDDQDQKLAAFEQKYVGQLPGEEQTNFNLLNTLNTQLEVSTQNLGRMEQDKTYLEAMIGQQSAAQPGQSAAADTPLPQQLQTQIEQLQTQLATLEGRYTPNYPDVLKTRRELQVLKSQLQATSASPAPKAAQKTTVETPQLQQLRANLRSLETGIADNRAEQERIRQQVNVYQARLQMSPVIEEEAKKLTRDHDTAQDFYNQLLAKKNQSEMAADLDRRQQGEQFRLLDPATLPQRPSFPNPPLFVAGGLFAGLLFGAALVALLEFLDQSLRNERDVLALTNMETLAVVPIVRSALQSGNTGKKGAQLRPQRRRGIAIGGRT